MAQVGIDIDTSQVEAMFDRMDKQVMKPAWKATFRKAIAIVANEIKDDIKRLYPYGKRENSGMLRGIHYGALYKDVKISVYKSGQGANVSIYSNPKKSTRWCVLYWLNGGNEKKRTAYTIVATKKPSNRGKIEGSGFFAIAAHRAESRAMQVLQEQLPDQVAKSANKQLNK